MSASQVNQLVLCCDGCGAQGPQAGSAVELRAMAYIDGWRFPARLKADGKPSARSDDFCPDCIAGVSS